MNRLTTVTLAVLLPAPLTTLHAVGAAGLSGLDGFLAGYRFAFTAAGGGLLVALLLSCLWPRTWFRG